MAASKAAARRNGSAERIRRAAIALFKARGYHGTSVRALADALRIEAASLYYHFPSKQEILFDLFERTMDALYDGLERAIAGGNTPEEKLRAAVRFHVLFHIARQDEAFISHSELRSLSPENHRRVIRKRDRYEKAVRDLLAAGVRRGDFVIADVRLATIAILMMCSGVSDWFAGRGRLTPAKVADRYADMVIRLVTERR
jgi:AcrR family transcriptional regulator